MLLVDGSASRIGVAVINHKIPRNIELRKKMKPRKRTGTDLRLVGDIFTYSFYVF